MYSPNLISLVYDLYVVPTLLVVWLRWSLICTYNTLPVSYLTVESMPVVGTVHEVTGAAHSRAPLLIQCQLNKVYLLFPNVDGMCDHLHCLNFTSCK